jgi:hypothetical protein
VLRTRAPVVSGKASFSLLPLDLHVLGLPLAFILSQDQTLRCKNIEFFVLFRFDDFISYCNLSKNFFLNQFPLLKKGLQR